MLLRITTNPEEQVNATADGCIDAMVADARYYFEKPEVRLGAVNIVFNCAVNGASSLFPNKRVLTANRYSCSEGCFATEGRLGQGTDKGLVTREELATQ